MIGVRVALLETSNDGMNINYRALYTTFRGKSIDDCSQSSQFLVSSSTICRHQSNLQPIFWKTLCMQIDAIDGDVNENRSQKLDVLPIRWYRVMEWVIFL